MFSTAPVYAQIFDWGLQATTITQATPSFRDPYEGGRSFRNEGSTSPATSFTTTIFTAVHLWKGAWGSVQPEFASGDGVGGGQGIAAYPNLDVVRVPTINARPYIARVFIQQVVVLGSGREKPEEAPPEDKFLPGGAGNFGNPGLTRGLSVTAGRISLPDFFDTNGISGDAHHGLMNWALANDGAWDYAANTRGYDWGITARLQWDRWALMAGSYLMPTVANGPDFDEHIRQAHSENLELDWTFDRRHDGVLRLLGYVNHAKMGDYEEALKQAGPASPDVTATRRAGRRKAGLGLNLQRMLSATLGLFARAGWDDGKTETFAYTEIDRTLSAGFSASGSGWRRPGDSAVLGVVGNGLSPEHRRYLEAGGLGFQIGDGKLNYGYEMAAELGYDAALTRAVAASLDVQYVGNPGYNRDRGPMMVYGLRLHCHL